MLSIHRFFPFLAIAVSGLAWYQPQPLLSWGSAIVPLLMAVMFCMGLTLRIADFKRVWNNPQPIALGVILQFGLMPLIAWALAWLLNLSPELALGLILVGCCAGGTASNVMTYLAGGDVALSVSLTLMSTLWGVALTPYLVWFYSGAEIDVDTTGMILTLVKLVVVPLVLGLSIRHGLPQFVQKLESHLADIASAIILAIIAIIVALNSDELAAVAGTTMAAVILHNLLGLGLGYLIAKSQGLTEVQARTLAIEVGMQNSGLAVALALKFYTPLVALPGALFSIWHNISGSLLASFWQWQTQRKVRQVQAQFRSKAQNLHSKTVHTVNSSLNSGVQHHDCGTDASADSDK